MVMKIKKTSRQLREAEQRFGPIGVLGVYGVSKVIKPSISAYPLAAERIGWVVDRGRQLRDGLELPAQVATLDELLLVVRRDAGLRFDPTLGFHLYGADICLQAREQGLAVVAIAALCHHNSSTIGLFGGHHTQFRGRNWVWCPRNPELGMVSPEARNPELGMVSPEAQDYLANPDRFVGDVDTVLKQIMTGVDLVHAVYYTHDECIDGIASWIARTEKESRLPAPDTARSVERSTLR